MPDWLTTGYRTALLSNDPKIHGLLAAAPHIGGIPILINVPHTVRDRHVHHLVAVAWREGKAREQHRRWKGEARGARGVHHRGRAEHINTANYHPFAPNGFKGVHQGAAIVSFAYIGFDAISTAIADKELAAQPADWNPRWIGDLYRGHLYRDHRRRPDGDGAVRRILGKAADPLAYALKATGMNGIAKVVALGAVFSMAAVLLVFQYGQPRIFYAMARDGLLPRWAARVSGKARVPYATTIFTGVFVALWSG